MTATTNQENQAGKFARRYRNALRRYLRETSRTKPAAALKLGQEAVRLGLEVLDLAAIHENALIDAAPAMQLAAARRRVARRAATFFAEASVPIEATHRTAIENNARLLRLNRELKQRAREAAVVHRKLNAEIVRRRTVEQNLRKSESESNQLLRQSRELQEDLRRLSRRILTTQEEERKRISRELHDIVAQTLTAINVHLATLKAEYAKNAKGINRNITRTQRLVERSVDKVHRFARELRPAVLDDLGLIPALRSLLEHFAKEFEVRVHMTACAKVEKLNNDRRTVLYRVAQEALTNVARHARADRVTVFIEELPKAALPQPKSNAATLIPGPSPNGRGAPRCDSFASHLMTEQSNAICMRIHDNGRSFDVERLLRSNKSQRMGLLGMRERVEMVGGRLAVASAPGKGTTVSARVPFRNGFKETQRT